MEEILFPLGTNFDPDHEKLLFEHYKLLTQTSEQLAARRQAINNFFLSINTFILAGMGLMFKDGFQLYVHQHKLTGIMILDLAFALIGLLIDANWSALIHRYGKLLGNQMRIAEALEKHMVAAIVTAQVTFDRKDFQSLTTLERNITHAFQAVYLASAASAIFMIVYQPVFHGAPPPAL